MHKISLLGLLADGRARSATVKLATLSEIDKRLAHPLAAARERERRERERRELRGAEQHRAALSRTLLW